MKVKITGEIIELTVQLKKDVLFTHFFPLSFFFIWRTSGELTGNISLGSVLGKNLINIHTF